MKNSVRNIAFKKALLVLCFALPLLPAKAANPHRETNRDSLRELRRPMEFLIPDRSLKIMDVKIVQQEDWSELFRIPEHPAFDRLLTPAKEREILGEINARRHAHISDTLLTADYFHIWRPYFDWLENEDPHYRAYPVTYASPEHYKNLKKIYKDPGLRRLPFDCILIDDTLIVSRTFDEEFYKVGDMIVSINGVTVPEYMKYNYADRHIFPHTMMLYYYYSFAVDNFDIELVRDGRKVEFNTRGQTQKYVQKHLDREGYNITVYEEAGAGYIQVRKFYPFNTRLIRIVHRAIEEFKSQGIENVIIDMRRNTGGRGHNFDKLLSIFINKPSVPYVSGQKLKVSENTVNDFPFLTSNMTGMLADLPDRYLVKEIPLDKGMYVDGMNYYILVSKDTGSIAASFVNILQYNGAATIAGEPLRRNALKYGETITGNDLYPSMLIPTGISTMQIDEYTKAVDGVLVPDIDIPYVASQYLTGRDAVLERLLEIIKSK